MTTSEQKDYQVRHSLTGRVAELVFDYLAMNLETRHEFYERLAKYTEITEASEAAPYAASAGGVERAALEKLNRRIQYERTREFTGSLAATRKAGTMLAGFTRMINPKDPGYYAPHGKYEGRTRAIVCEVCGYNKTVKRIFVPSAELPPEIVRQFGESIAVCPPCKKRLETDTAFALEYKLKLQGIVERAAEALNEF